MVGERRVVTILFCDVQGSTSASQDMDPEDWAEIMNGVFEQMIAPVYRYEGFVARLMGDSILAFFGAPIAHEDDPQRAILAGLDITKSINAFSEQLFQERGLRLAARVGINTGLVVVGTVGSDLRMEYTAMGDAINLAARMEQTAQPGAVQITAETQKLAAPYFISEDLGAFEIKGKNEPIQAFNVIEPRSNVGRLQRIDSQISPLIGRDAEFRKIQGSIEDLQRGLGAIVYITGEAGLGKSRLISEIKSQVLPDAAVSWYEISNLSYDTGQPYASFKRLFRDLMKVEIDDSQEILYQKIKEFVLDSHISDSDQFLQVIQSLFGLDANSSLPVLEGEAFRGLLYTSFSAFWEQQTAQKPVVLVCDDLHWSDPASIGLLERLYALVDRSPILIISASRPELESTGWKSREYAASQFPHRYIQIDLRPLTPDDSGKLVDRLLDISDFPAAMRARILEKADGNPYFVEEVVRSLIDHGLIIPSENGPHWMIDKLSDEMEIPDNLQSLLLARIDSLHEDSRWILQVAAVIGRTFYYQVLAKLVDTTQGLDVQLVSLQRHQLIQEAARLPELEYSFKHVLVQEVAYGTLLIREKKQFHLRVAQAIEELYPDRASEYAPILAHHYQLGDDPLHALHYFRLAGDDAFRLFAAGEASDHYSKALGILLDFDPDQPLIEGEDREKLVEHLFLRKGRALELNQQFDLAMANYSEMLNYAAETNNSSIELASQIASLTLHSIPGPQFDLVVANQIAERVLVLASQLDDQASEAKIYWSLAILNVMARDSSAAIDFAERSIAISRQLNLEDQLAYSLNDLARAYLGQGDFDQAQIAAAEAHILFQKMGNLPMLGDNILSTAETHLTLGNYQRSYESYQEMTELAASIDNMWLRSWGLTGTGYISIDYGNFSTGIEMISEVVEIADRIGIEMLAAGSRSQLALIYAYLGDQASAEGMAENALTIAQSDSYPVYFRTWPYAAAARVFNRFGDFKRAKSLLDVSFQHYDPEEFLIIYLKQVSFAAADIALAQGKFTQAGDEMDILINQPRNRNVRSLLPEALRIKGQALMLNNQISEALHALLEAKSESENLGERREYWKILAGLAEIEQQQGNLEKAIKYQQLAKETITYIADHISDLRLLGKFQRLPEIARIMSGEIR